MNFVLEKWYLDVVSPEGEVVILYDASVEFGMFKLRHRSALAVQGDGSRTHTTRRSHAPVPIVSTAGCSYATELVQGTWSRRASSLSARLLDSPRGVIDWNVHVPSADVEVRFAERVVRGTGYVEQLRMTLLPWRFPFRGLRWGRWIADDRWLVWIDWSGGPTGIGGEREPTGERRFWSASARGIEHIGEASETMVATSAHRLMLDSSRTIHDAALHESLGSAARLIAPMIPASFLNLHETKWLSRGVLHSPAGTIQGMALHESVVFPLSDGEPT
jgi:hypothetical protein